MRYLQLVPRGHGKCRYPLSNAQHADSKVLRLQRNFPGRGAQQVQVERRFEF